MTEKIAYIRKKEDGQGFFAQIKTITEEKALTLPFDGVGYELRENERIYIMENKSEKEVASFIKIETVYELEGEDDNIHFKIYEVEKAGDIELRREVIDYTEEILKDLPGDIRIKVIFFSKKRKEEELKLKDILEEISFSIQSKIPLSEIEEEYKDYHLKFNLEVDKFPFITIERSGVQKTIVLQWDKTFHKNILKDNLMKVPIELAEEELYQLDATQLLPTDIKVYNEGKVVVINGVRYYFKDAKARKRLEEINPTLYEKVCKAMVSEKVKKTSAEELKGKYRELKVLTEDGDVYLYREKKVHFLESRSQQNYVRRMLGKEVFVPIHVFETKTEELSFYLGEDREFSNEEFKEKVKEILHEKLEELEEFYGWKGTAEIFTDKFMNKEFLKEKDVSANDLHLSDNE